MLKVKDEIYIEPSLEGEAARAWRCDVETLRDTYLCDVSEDPLIALWVVEAPGVHPIWHSYQILLLHLRDLPDMPAPKIYLEGATHEFWLNPIDPNGKRQFLIEGRSWDMCRFIAPTYFCAQIIEPDDDAASARCENAVKMICDGKLSLAPAYMLQWVRLFGDNMVELEASYV